MRKGVFIPDITVEMFKNASLESVEEFMTSGQMEDVVIPDRPHGEWEHWGSPFSDDSIANSIVCSLCKARYVEIEDEVFNFCPNCGADMKEGDTNDQL